MDNTVKKSIKPIFIIWIISSFCYLPLIANSLTNSVDGLWASTYAQAGNWELSIGRWAWLFLDKARDGYGAEPFNSLLTLLLIAVAIYVSTDIFMTHGERPRYRFYIYAMIAMCSTTVCCYLSYRFMSPTFGMSVLLATVAARLIVTDSVDKKNAVTYFIYACASLVVSLGLYQANIGCFCVIVIMVMVKIVLNDDSKNSLMIMGKAFLCGVVSCALYKVAWDLCLMARHVNPDSYNGADSLSIMNMVRYLPKSIMRIYKYWISYFKFLGSNYVFLPIREMVVVLIFALVIYTGIKKLRKTPGSLMLFLLFLVLLPVGANIFIILAPESMAVLTQMTFPMMFVIPLFLCFLSGISMKMDKLLCFLAMIILYGNIYAVGTDIDAMAQGSNSSNTIMNNIVVSLNEKQLASADYQYAFYGNISENVMFKKNELYDMASQYAKFGTMQTKADMVHKSYIGLVDDIGVNLEIVNDALYHEILSSGVLEDIPAYPEEGSIIVKNGVVIVKVSEDY